MRAFAVALLASLSLCPQADRSQHADGDSAHAPRADTSPRAAERSAGPAQSDTFQRAPGQSAESFAAGLGPAPSDLTHPVIETDAWKLGGKAVIAFYRYDVRRPALHSSSHDPVFEAIGYAFLPQSSNRYRRVLIGDVGHEGGEPEIRSVFFANADENPGPELIVIAVWQVMNALTDGTIYATQIYALPPAGADRFVYLEELSEKVSGGCECEWREERRSRRAPYKTAADVRARLRELGYR
jgi:hypothetical protein